MDVVLDVDTTSTSRRTTSGILCSHLWMMSWTHDTFTKWDISLPWAPFTGHRWWNNQLQPPLLAGDHSHHINHVEEEFKKKNRKRTDSQFKKEKQKEEETPQTPPKSPPTSYHACVALSIIRNAEEAQRRSPMEKGATTSCPTLKVQKVRV